MKQRGRHSPSRALRLVESVAAPAFALLSVEQHGCAQLSSVIAAGQECESEERVREQTQKQLLLVALGV